MVYLLTLFSDIEECSIGNHTCSSDAECINTNGSYNCSCKAGFVGDGRNCSDIDECLAGNHTCSSDATCITTNGSYNCSCKAGFVGDGRNCSDIDECLVGNHTCSSDAECINTNGSFHCSCKAGYVGDGRNCSDIEECSIGNHTCSSDAECINTNGSYICSCKAGFVGDGRNCSDQVRMAWFPLNATFNTSEINNRVPQGLSKKVTLAIGPDGREGGSYKFQQGDDKITFSNNQGGYLDMRFSVTILYWLYHCEVTSLQKVRYHIHYMTGSSKGLGIFHYGDSQSSGYESHQDMVKKIC
ncbi:protein kinase C-binding protein NELL2-like [Montipora capricornis]|uniref:protein kinase C-binding protein NELL2-like n=1 Tax=Montipora capricornis TaxID=246305 RepID=UPI0035F14B6C